uniref:SirB2 family protein n=1 Tax=Escherichia coli TaxID=562 RepID=UPI000BE528E8|nr:SirB2 family protein [Escherichia coli]
MLPSETMIWQPEFTDKTLSRKPGAVQFGVIIYIVLGFIALDYRRMHSQQARIIAFPLALVVLYIIIKLATTKVPLLG